MTRTTPFRLQPSFCRICGHVLSDVSSGIETGFDAFEGNRLPERVHITRRCPVEGHDAWVLVDGGTPSAAWVLP